MSFIDVDDEIDAYTPRRLPEEFEQEAMLARAVSKAALINGELLGQIPGMLKDYVEHELQEAANAAGELLVAHPDDSTRIFEMQKQVQGYARVIDWINKQFAEADRAEAEAESQLLED